MKIILITTWVLVIFAQSLYSQQSLTPAGQEFGAGFSVARAFNDPNRSSGFNISLAPGDVVEVGLSYSTAKVKVKDEDGRFILRTITIYGSLVSKRDEKRPVTVEFTAGLIDYSGDIEVQGTHVPASLTISRDFRANRNIAFGEYLTVNPELGITRVFSFNVSREEKAPTVHFALDMIFNRESRKPMFVIAPGLVLFKGDITLGLTAGLFFAK